MKVLVTGAKGFVGKNLVASLKAQEKYEVLEFDIDNTKEDLKKFTSECEFVVNLAGVNRPETPKEFYEGNAGFAETLCKYLKENSNKSPILISSSIQAEQENDYGKSKKAGEELLTLYGKENNVEIYIYRFANLFGKWCRPNYNSVVATWCYNVANGLPIQINNEEAMVELCYIDDVVSEISNAIDGNAVRESNSNYYKVKPTHITTLGKLSSAIHSFKDSRANLEVPNMSDELTMKLYSTYLSYLPKDEFSYPLITHEDARGSFTEFIRTKGYGQVSVNISKPGITKGNHWHHTKNEKFLVVSGEGVIRFRNVNETEIIEYEVSGSKLTVIDIPTGYTHSIVNVGTSDMVTIMWANESFDPEKPDTFYEEV